MIDKTDEERERENKEKRKEFKNLMESITPMDFFRFLNVRGVTETCQSCGKDGLQVTATSTKANLGELLEGKKGKSFVTYFRLTPDHPGDSDQNYYYKSFCENCGYITMHAVTPVLQWLQSEANQGEAEDEQL